MKKIVFLAYFYSLLLLGAFAGLIALETPQTPNVNKETLEIEKTVEALKGKQLISNKLLGKNPTKIKDLTAPLKNKITQIKVKKAELSHADLNKLADEALELVNQIEAEASKL